MADKKISELANAAPLGVGDAFEIVQGGESKQASGSQVSTLVTASSELAASVNPRFNAKAGRQALVFDGLTGRVDIPGGAAALQQKDRVLTYVFETNAKQETFRQFFYLKSTSPTADNGGVGILNNENTQRLAVVLKLEGLSGNHYAVRWNDVFDGLNHAITVEIDYTGTDPVITATKNGVSLGSPIVDVAKNGAFNDTTATNIRLGSGASGQFLRGSLGKFLAFNYAIPPTTDGIPGAAERYRDGRFLTSGDLQKMSTLISATIRNGGFETEGTGGNAFADWAESYFSGAGTITRDTEVFDTGLASCKIVTDGSNTNTTISQPGLLTAGNRYRVTLRAKGGGTAASERFTLSTGASPFVFFEQAVTTDWQTFTKEFTAVGTSFAIGRGSTGSAGQTLYFDSFLLEPLGATLALESEGIQAERGQWLDSSANKLHALQAATGTKPLLRLSTSVMVVEGVDASSAVFLLGARDILTDDWTVESVELFNDGGDSEPFTLKFSNGSLHVGFTGSATTIAAGTSKTIQVTNGKPIGYNRIRAEGGATSDDITFILNLKPRR